ncbi:PREDICTED: E3 ubiquitin-protein ligase TRAF7-like [Amphimedon queenslandica]|uniref:E3 ubiquitin-protein ligase TRAF7 n=1 Tax=Amphimedon queenslandica TaxID=400682 RepID=A0A1X7V6W6_AMPQE|nr:PREDICTED: E3 ubiquitin-protein ligase TRAF7-like [Amphimedon queenslandica]|eukprot:XP_019850390.1 PREDICTED: E3 ubiquitin-protein ligase TRAF7-like [Amphimedon queenslandica]
MYTTTREQQQRMKIEKGTQHQRTYSFTNTMNPILSGSSPISSRPIRSSSFNNEEWPPLGPPPSYNASKGRHSVASDILIVPGIDSRDSCSTPTNYSGSLLRQGSMPSSRGLISPMTNQSNPEEDFKEIIVLAESDKHERLLCPLCGGVFRDPYIATCGHTFCSPCLRSGREEVCPIDNIVLSMVVKNLAVAEQVGELHIHCRFGCKQSQEKPWQYEPDPLGCPMILKLANRDEHEKECDYAPVKCPNSSLCPPILKRDLNDHLRSCRHVRCPHHRFNCPFEGTKEEMAHHLEICKFEGLKGYLARTEDSISQLQAEIKQKDDEISFLRSMLAGLSDKIDHLEKGAVGKIEQLDERQVKLSKDVSDARNAVDFVMNELQHVQVQLGVAGTMDLQHIFKCKGTFVGHSGPVWALCVINDLLFSGSSDNTIKVWDAAIGFKCIKTLTGHDGIVLALRQFGDNYMYSGSADQSIKKWDIEKFQVISTIAAHENPVCTLTTSNDRLFSGSLKSIKVWDTANNTMIKELPAQNHWVRSLVVSDVYLYSGSYQAVKIWDLMSLECIRVLECLGGSVYSLLVTANYVACGTYENKINVWNIETLESVGQLTGHFGIVYALHAIETPGQTKLFSAAYDKTLRVWNMEHLTCSQTLIRHESSVTCLAMARGRLFSGSVDSTIKVWQ